MAAREDRLTQTFVQLADSLVDEFDIIDLLTTLAQRCIELLEADAAGILLADDRGRLRIMSASSEQTRLLELFELQNQEGPGLECHAGGTVVADVDLASSGGRWPRFAPEATQAGFGCVYALPLRHREAILGALTLFRRQPGPMLPADLHLAQGFADVATIAILQDQAVRHAEIRAGELQHALDSRVVIEQAKGMLAERGRLDVDEAFSRLRRYARGHNRPLTAVASDVIVGRLPLTDVLRQEQRESHRR